MYGPVEEFQVDGGFLGGRGEGAPAGEKDIGLGVGARGPLGYEYPLHLARPGVQVVYIEHHALEAVVECLLVEPGDEARPCRLEEELLHRHVPPRVYVEGEGEGYGVRDDPEGEDRP